VKRHPSPYTDGAKSPSREVAEMEEANVLKIGAVDSAILRRPKSQSLGILNNKKTAPGATNTESGYRGQ